MKTKIKFFISGLIVGAVLAFPLGMNYGRGKPLLSDPFYESDLDRVKRKTGNLLQDTKKTIHDATKP